MTVMTEICVQEAWLSILYSRFKIEVAEDRHNAMFRMLDNYAIQLGETPESLLNKAQSRQLTPEHWTQVIHRATNHETRFYRNKAVVELVAQFSADVPRARILSVGCSTGEEPYTFAVELGLRKVPNYQIFATDVSAVCIEKAKAATYPENACIPERFAKRDGQGNMRFYEWIKDFVTFSQHNVLADWPIDFPKPTLIVTQNMLIYYRRETRHRILDSLSLMLEKGGYLITGPGEDASWNPTTLERLSVPVATVFRKN
tara:strand:- start:19 stop:792 length:774 start_codon:yes stop_codon:yes gene_type:complete